MSYYLENVEQPFITFGKHKLKTYKWLAENDASYARWLLDQPWFKKKMAFCAEVLTHWLSQTPSGWVVDIVDKPHTLCNIAKVALGPEGLARSAAHAKEMSKRFPDAEQDPAVTHECGAVCDKVPGWDATYCLGTFVGEGFSFDNIELKIVPTLGDDWRSVLKRVAAMPVPPPPIVPDTRVVAICEYTGSKKHLKQVALAFEESNIRLIKLCMFRPGEDAYVYPPANVDPWHEALIRWLADCKAGDLFTIEAFLDCMVGRQCDTDHRRVAEMLTKLGCIQTGEYLPGTDGRVEFWQRPT